jgi:hypothetical protein
MNKYNYDKGYYYRERFVEVAGWGLLIILSLLPIIGLAVWVFFR